MYPANQGNEKRRKWSKTSELKIAMESYDLLLIMCECECHSSVGKGIHRSISHLRRTQTENTSIEGYGHIMNSYDSCTRNLTKLSEIKRETAQHPKTEILNL